MLQPQIPAIIEDITMGIFLYIFTLFNWFEFTLVVLSSIGMKILLPSNANTTGTT
jgi:hypothetical protein